MRIMVTGSSGTIGSRLCEMLSKKGHSVTGVDIRKNEWVKVKTELIDLRNQKNLLNLKGHFDIIVHLAANARVYDLVLDPQKALDNITMAFNVLEYARANKIRRVIFSSSREVYGNSREIVAKEEDVTLDSESPYSASKASGESLMHAYQKCYGIDFIIFRFSNVYGMYDDSDRVVPRFISKAMKNDDIEIFGRDKVLDFTYIDDCIDGVILGIEKFEKMKGSTLNLASGYGTSIVDIAGKVCKIVGSKSRIKYSGNRSGEVVRYIGNISKLVSFGWKPKVGIDEGLKKSVEWYKR